MVQNVFIVGATGNVGRELVRQIYEKDTDRKNHDNPTRIIGLASSKYALYNPEGIAKTQGIDFSGRNITGSRYDDLHEIVAQTEKIFEGRNVVFVDVTAENGVMSRFHLDVIRNFRPFSIVTANKNPIAMSPYSIFRELTQDVNRYKYSCSVMAGAGAVDWLADARDLGDKVHEIKGCFSGTLGYLCSELEKGRPFSSILFKAREEGYTEPHPRDDLSGKDVARKLIVLARTLGIPIEFTECKVKPFIPEKYLKINDVDSFMESIKGYDEVIRQRMGALLQEGKTFRYVASLVPKKGQVELAVSLEEVAKDDDLGMLEGTTNIIKIVSDNNPKEKPYVMKAAGAGLGITAANVRRDLLHILEGRKATINH